MNTYISRLFNLQTTILLNHTLLKLIKFFMTPSESSTSLYHSILTLRESSKKELTEQGKKLPVTCSYEIIAEKIDSKLVVKLHRENLSDVEVYCVALENDHPPMHLLKTIAHDLVSKYRPMPTKVDKEFANLAKKYSDYLNCYQVKRCWQHGYIGINTLSKPYDKALAKTVNKSYTLLISDVQKLVISYRTFTKILIDIYQNDTKKAIEYRRNEHIMWVENTEYGISVIVDNNDEQISQHEIVQLVDYCPTTFVNFPRIIIGAVNCITPLLSKKKR